MKRFIWLVLIVCLSGCAEKFSPRIAGAGSPETGTAVDYQRFASQFEQNRMLAADDQRKIVILIETPAYGLYDQIRAGNMGHAAIEVDGKLHDIGSQNGYARTFAATRAVRFWNFRTAEEALGAVRGHRDSDGAMPRITRFDVTVTEAQAKFLADWWSQMDDAAARPKNRLYFWNSWQCASAVSASLQEAGITYLAPSSPNDLRCYLEANLRHTCGPEAGKPARVTIVQMGSAGETRGPVRGMLGLVWHSPVMLAAGRRTPLEMESPDGVRDRILWSDSEAYRQQIKTFQITPEAAAKLMREKMVGIPGEAIPNFVVGRWYHFPSDHIIGQAALAGCYVDGGSGQIKEVQTTKIIRFDLFHGDTIVSIEAN